jgi:hypothetical protein
VPDVQWALRHAEPAGTGTGVQEQSASLSCSEVSEGRSVGMRAEANKKKTIEWPQANGRFPLAVATTSRGSGLLHFRDGYLELHSTEALTTRASKGITFKR